MAPALPAAAPVTAATAAKAAESVLSRGLGIAEALSPEEGFAYNQFTIVFDVSEDEPAKPQTPAPAAGVAAPTGPPQPAPPAPSQSPKRLPPEPRVSRGPVIFRVVEGEFGEQTTVQLALEEVSYEQHLAGVLTLRRLENFDTALFDNLAVEMSAEKLAARAAILQARIFINTAGIGWAHVSAGLLIRVDTASGSPRLASRALFANQNPKRGRGRGLFGKVIETYASGEAISLKAYYAPLGSG